ncbi:MAG: alcohol dehydrogenase catalytic domain-containing protein [Phycisphaerales bacterium]
MHAVVREDKGVVVHKDWPEPGSGSAPTTRPTDASRSTPSERTNGNSFEALVRLTRAGISSFDVAVSRGLVNFRGVMGHEFVGIVEKIIDRAGTSDIPESASAWIGKRVVGSKTIVCGRCERCRGGLSSHCTDRTVLGTHGRDGCFAERFLIPVTNLAELPKGVSDDAGVFAQGVAAAVHAAKVMRLESKAYITVLGDGPMGLLCAQVMARLNASVRLLGTHPAKFSLCERWGVKHRHVAEVGLRQDQDVVVDCTGSASGITLALRLVRPRGKVILKSAGMLVNDAGVATGATLDGPKVGARGVADGGIDLSLAVVNEVELIGVRCGKIAEGVSALAKGEVDVSALVTGRSRLDDAVEALSEAADTRQIKVVLEP